MLVQFPKSKGGSCNLVRGVIHSSQPAIKGAGKRVYQSEPQSQSSVVAPEAHQMPAMDLSRLSKVLSSTTRPRKVRL